MLLWSYASQHSAGVSPLSSHPVVSYMTPGAPGTPPNTPRFPDACWLFGDRGGSAFCEEGLRQLTPSEMRSSSAAGRLAGECGLDSSTAPWGLVNLGFGQIWPEFERFGAIPSHSAMQYSGPPGVADKELLGMLIGQHRASSYQEVTHTDVCVCV